MTPESNNSPEQIPSKTVDQATQRDDQLECDLVMKGGITSGIVYPPLVLKLKDKYHFRSVGGTSAGAIAAAATAAAEYGREADGFKKLDDLNKQLSQDNFLRDLFQPSQETRPLMETAFALIGLKNGQSKETHDRVKAGGFRGLTKLLDVLDETVNRPDLSYSKGARLGFVAGVGSALFISFIALFVLLLRSMLTGEASFWWLSLVPLLALAGPLVTLGRKAGGISYSVRDLYNILTKRVTENGFGFCTGHKDQSMPPKVEVLTDWLHLRIDDMAGISDRNLERHKAGYKPLTFGDLKDKRFGDKRDDESPKQENISLRMVTSNLSQNQPFVLPFKDDHLFLFNVEEFRRLFPTDVVDYMVRVSESYHKPPRDSSEDQGPEDSSKHKSTKGSSKYELYEPQGMFKFMLEADDLPVIVATRMSLSFPILLSAVPLYTIKTNKVCPTGWVSDDSRQLGKDDLQLNWFSDGGICSNFPIHFFDSWLPSRPTFGVNLTSLPKTGLVDKDTVNKNFISIPVSQDQAGLELMTDAIYLPKAHDLPATEWIPLTDSSAKRNPDLLKFLWAIFSTAQNYRDNAQSMLPSYRERIVQIRLSEDEGGLNLAMPSGTISNVMKKGVRAGELLKEFKFPVHKWVRFRVLMKQMEISLNKMNDVMNKDPFYLSNLNSPELDPEFPYKGGPDWRKDANRRLILMGKLIHEFQTSIPPTIFSEEAPLPEPVLRVTPEI